VTHARYIIGDVFDVMATLEDGSVDLVLTSPPFLALRSYLPADHPDKAKEIGSEPTPAEFLDTLLALTAEWGRLLAPHGSLCVELGDTYSGVAHPGGDYAEGGWREGQPRFRHVDTGRADGWPLDKSLCIIPELYAACLAYGRNVLTGEESPAGQWRVRNLVRWVRPNPPVGALGDKFRPATSVMTVACKARDRWFDLDDVRVEAPRTDNRRTTSTQYAAPGQPERKTRAADDDGARLYANPAGAPPLDWWQIPTEPYSGSHYATWPRKLCERPIRSMCPREVCRVCGEPRRRVVGDVEYVPSESHRGGVMIADAERVGDGVNQWKGEGGARASVVRQATTLGWTDCGHDDYRPGAVLDPFAGSGTTLAVATGHGRDAIGIDLDARNGDLARERVGMFLSVTEGAA
jgi:DNA modification methylase